MNFWQFIAANWRDILTLTREHLLLSFAATGLAALVGVPLGVLLTRIKELRGPVLGFANVMQTVPSLALFGLLIPLPLVGGIGARPALVALTLYALLPILRTTVTGLLGVDAGVREAAEAMGLTAWQRLRLVELPLAMRVILAGARVALVLSVGVTTIAAAVGAGGLGTYIFRGLRQYDNNLLLAGALPAALLALAADFALGLVEKRFDFAAPRRSAHSTRRVLCGVAVATVLLLAAVWWTRPVSVASRVTVGAKDFTESVLLGEIVAQMLEARGVAVERKFELGGNLCHEGLRAGEVDVYPEYTGTAFTAILKHPPVTDPQAVYEQVRREYAANFNLEVGPPLGFSNDFAILVRGADAKRLNLKTISDATPHASHWRAGFGQDFMSRADGYPGFAKTYGLHFAAPPREMDLSLTYRALAAGEVDLIAGNSTDGLIAALDLTQLQDNRRYFPPYEAVLLARRDTLERVPQLAEVLQKLARALTTDEMRRLNYAVDGEKRDRAEVARKWLVSKDL